VQGSPTSQISCWGNSRKLLLGPGYRSTLFHVHGGRKALSLGPVWSRFLSYLCCPMVLGLSVLLLRMIPLRVKLLISCPLSVWPLSTVQCRIFPCCKLPVAAGVCPRVPHCSGSRSPVPMHPVLCLLGQTQPVCPTAWSPVERGTSAPLLEQTPPLSQQGLN